jgi:hypothetical protein
MVRKKNGKWRICVDYTSHNKACPKDPFPLSRIDDVADSTAGCILLCFLVAYSGYHQVPLKELDQEATSFITPYGCYCYVKMPFGLRNARATYRQCMQKCFCRQIGRNLEVYFDDLVVKTRSESDFISDLEETFTNLR